MLKLKYRVMRFRDFRGMLLPENRILSTSQTGTYDLIDSQKFVYFSEKYLPVLLWF